MTAVSEGAAIFAEAVDWDSDEHERKGTHEQIKSDGELGLSFRYESRTPDKKARIAVVLKREVDGFTLKISSLDTGRDSGLVALRNKEIVAVPLHKRGGHFKSGGTIGVTRDVTASSALRLDKTRRQKFNRSAQVGRIFFGRVTKIFRDIGRAVDDDDYEKLQQTGDLASEAISANNYTHDAEELNHLEEQLAEARKTLADFREQYRFKIRRSDLDGWRSHYKSDLKNFAEPSEAEQMETLFARAETLVERDDTAFDDALNEIRDLGYTLLFRNDENIAYLFNQLVKHPEDATDRESFYRLVQAGNAALSRKDFVELRRIIGGLLSLSRHTQDEFLKVNLFKA